MKKCFQCGGNKELNKRKLNEESKLYEKPCICDCDIHGTGSGMARRAGISRPKFQRYTEVYSSYHFKEHENELHTHTDSLQAGTIRAQETANEGKKKRAESRGSDGRFKKMFTDVSGGGLDQTTPKNKK